MTDNVDVDPRECLYRTKPKSAIRRQMEKLIQSKKKKLIFFSKNEANNGSVVNRFRKPNETLEHSKMALDDKNDEDDLFTPKQLLDYIERMENILSLSDDEQKQSFTYQNLVDLHRYMQYLDDKYRDKFFYEFLDQFRVVQFPKRRGNESLDQRIRRLKTEAAAVEYNSMIANVSHCINGQAKKSGSKHKTPYSFREDIRMIRSTILATINAFMVIVATFFFIYYAIGYIRTDITTEHQVLFSFVSAMVVAIAEIYFLLRIV